MTQAQAVSESDVHEAFRTIIKNKNEETLNYAVNYAIYGLGCTGKELRVQTPYVLSNISYWRTDEGKEVRATLKAFVKASNKRG